MSNSTFNRRKFLESSAGAAAVAGLGAELVRPGPPRAAAPGLRAGPAVPGTTPASGTAATARTAPAGGRALARRRSDAGEAVAGAVGPAGRCAVAAGDPVAAACAAVAAGDPVVAACAAVAVPVAAADAAVAVPVAAADASAAVAGSASVRPGRRAGSGTRDTRGATTTVLALVARAVTDDSPGSARHRSETIVGIVRRDGAAVSPPDERRESHRRWTRTRPPRWPTTPRHTGSSLPS